MLAWILIYSILVFTFKIRHFSKKWCNITLLSQRLPDPRQKKIKLNLGVIYSFVSKLIKIYLCIYMCMFTYILFSSISFLPSCFIALNKRQKRNLYKTFFLLTTLTTSTTTAVLTIPTNKHRWQQRLMGWWWWWYPHKPSHCK